MWEYISKCDWCMYEHMYSVYHMTLPSLIYIDVATKDKVYTNSSNYNDLYLYKLCLYVATSLYTRLGQPHVT